MAFDKHTGANKLANTIADRINYQIPTDLKIDFGVINNDGSLTTNTFPVKIPKADYTVCRHISGRTIMSTTTNGYHPHNHSVIYPSLKPGDRVLVAWIKNEVCVIDVICPA